MAHRAAAFRRLGERRWDPDPGVLDPAPATHGRLVLAPLLFAAAIALLAALALTPAAASADTTPTVSAEAASEVGITTAKLSGAVNPNGNTGDGATAWRLQYSPTGTDHGESGNEGWSTANEGAIEPPASEEANEVEVESLLGFGYELNPGESYEFRLQAENAAGQASSASPYPTFTMAAVTEPTLSLEPVTAFGSATAQLAGHVDPEGGNSNPIGPEVFPIRWQFQVSTDGSTWSPVGSAAEIGAPEAAESSPIALSAEATGLLPHTAYQVRLHTAYGNFVNFSAETDSAPLDPAFTTDPAAPAFIHTFVSLVAPNSATLNAELRPGGAPTTVHFDYLLRSQYEASGFAGATSTPESESIGADNEPHPAQAFISGLEPDTEYVYRALATNSVESVIGETRRFHTEAIPPNEPDTCPNAALRSEQHATFLPDCRAYEMVSPPQKFGNDILPNTFRSRAAADGSAIEFLSYGSFADAVSVPYAAEYIAERTAHPATNGWASHSISPVQDPLTALGVSLANAEPLYTALSPDLSKGVFHAWSPLTEAPNIAGVPGPLYLRDDLRRSGPGEYRLLSDANEQLVASFGMNFNTRVAGASDDFGRVIFESRRPLRANADREDVKLYEKDSTSTVPRLIIAGPNCGFERFPGPCSAAGQSAFALHYTERTLSSDGSRVEFTDPVNPGQGSGVETLGAASRIFQLDDRGTSATADDALIQLNASEASSPELTKVARFGTASTDGRRVFFFSPEDLTGAAPGGGLYMWQRSEEDETQSLAVDASGGSFTLTAHTQPTIGSGDITEGSNEVTSITAGSFMVGQTLSGPGIPAGTQVTAMKSGPNRLILSQPATKTTPGARIEADVEATTPALPHSASAGEVQAAFEALSTSPAAPEEPRRLIGEGNVQVSGGPGSAGAGTPYDITFTGALAGVDVRPLSVNAGGLSGGGANATVSVADPVENLSLLANTEFGSAGTIGASEDGHRLYFIAVGAQLVGGGPAVANYGIYYWQDAEGGPEGTLSFVGEVFVSDTSASINYSLWNAAPDVARVTPDGRTLFFEASDGTFLAPRYDSSCAATIFGNPNNTSEGCSQIYLYRADTSTPTQPDLICASCHPSGEPPTDSAWVQWRQGTGVTQTGTYLSRALSGDGRYVFFSTATALVPRDTNGVKDAYAYDTQTEAIHLLSSGIDGFNSFFLDASTDGRDAFILTRGRLSRWDFDGNYDVYDVRVDGGLPEPPPPNTAACEGETCRGAKAPPPPLFAAGTIQQSFGNPHRPRRCPRGRHAVTKRGKTHCVARKHHRSHKRSRTDRGAGR